MQRSGKSVRNKILRDHVSGLLGITLPEGGALMLSTTKGEIVHMPTCMQRKYTVIPLNQAQTNSLDCFLKSDEFQMLVHGEVCTP